MDMPELTYLMYCLRISCAEKEPHILHTFIQAYMIPLNNVSFVCSGSKISKCLNVKIISEIISSRNNFVSNLCLVSK